MSVGYDNHSLNHNLVLDFTFEEGAGIQVIDRSRVPPYGAITDMVGTFVNTPVWTQFASGKWYLFVKPDADGTPSTNPEYITVPNLDSGVVEFTTQDFSLGMWVRIDQWNASGAHERALMWRGDLNTGWRWNIVRTAPDTQAQHFFRHLPGGGGSDAATHLAISLNTWYLLGVSREGTEIRLYVNGENRTDWSIAMTDPIATVQDLIIGADGTFLWAPWWGGLYRPRAWTRALSAGEWRELYNLEKGIVD